MKNTLLAVLLCFVLGSCLKDEAVTPEIIIDPIAPVLVSHDSITTGAYLGLKIEAQTTDVYAQIQALREKGVSYVQPVGDFSADLSKVGNRLVLYQSIYLAGQKPSDSDVQISIKAGLVQSIFLNNGTKIAQWPLREPAVSSVRMGDKAEVLFEKFVKISSKGIYSAKFDRISFFFKRLDTEYDPIMDTSNKWYFAYTTEDGLLEKVDMGFENGKLKYLLVDRFK